MVDRSTGSYWYQVAGSAIVGPLTGAELELLPSSVATWQQWRNDHPDTLILTRDTGYSRPYHRDSFALYGDTIDQGRFAFPVGEGARDDRLRPSELVVGIHLDGVTRAYPVERITEPTNDVVGGKKVVVVPIEGGAAVFSAVVGDKDLRFQSVGEEIADVETGSVWDSSGVAVSGDLAGTALDPIPARTTFWFALVGAFPEVEVYSTP